jgi:uroporphyrinogen decarboxylase
MLPLESQATEGTQAGKDKEFMIPKERVLAALHHEEPDRVPVDYDANAGLDARLKGHFGLAANDDEGLRLALGVDFREVVPTYRGPRLHAEIPGILVDPEWGIHRRWIEHETGGYWDYCDFPLSKAGEEEIEKWPMPSPDDYDYAAASEACRAYGQFAVYTGNPGLGDLINKSAMMRGMEQVLVDLITDDPAGLRLLDRRVAVQLEVTRRTLEAAKGGIDFLWLGEDLGTQIGPMISLALFRKHIRPRHQRFVDLAKAFGIPVMIHSCGSSSWAYEDFIEMGITAVDTLQPEARDMAPAYLKKRFGARLAFHGCISTAGPVAYGTVDDVRRNVRETLSTMMPGGGYCLAPTHSLQDNSPTDNVLAMYEAAQKYGKY